MRLARLLALVLVRAPVTFDKEHLQSGASNFNSLNRPYAELRTDVTRILHSSVRVRVTFDTEHLSHLSGANDFNSLNRSYTESLTQKVVA